MLVLQRVVLSKQGTFGVLLLNDVPVATTCEDPWEDNTKGVSCIPEGTYKYQPHNGTLYKNVWVIEDVPNRSGILLHNGNTIKHTEGCVLLGNGFGMLKGLPSITNSMQTLDKLRSILPKSGTIVIKNPK